MITPPLPPIEFGQAAPDQAGLYNPGVERANNVLPVLRGYRSFPSSVEVTNAIAQRARGAFSGRADNDPTITGSFVGDGGDGTSGSAKLYRLPTSGNSWLDASRAGGYDPTTLWEFAQFENEIFAVNGVDQVQYIALDVGTQFADIPLPADIITAKHLAVVRNFLVLGNVTDSTGTHADKLRWSSFLNPLGSWAISKVSQADFQELRGTGGPILRIIGGTTGIIFQENTVWRMAYVGSPFVFRIDNIDENIGTVSGSSCIRYGDQVFFLAKDGFRVITPAGASRSIGEERIDRTVLKEIAPQDYPNIRVGLSDNFKLVIWAYPGTGSLGGLPNKLAIYNFESDRWATGDEAVEVFFNLYQPARSIDDFDDDVVGQGTQTPPIYTTLENIPGSLDDRIWAGGPSTLGAFNSNHAAVTFTGPARSAEIETAETQPTAGRRTFVNYVRPLVDAGEVSVAVGLRNRQKDTVTFTPPVAENADGLCPVRVNARYLRYRVTTTGEFEDALGIQPFGLPSDYR